MLINIKKPLQFIEDLYISKLYFYNFQFNYDYNLKHLLYKRKGNVYGRLHNLDVNVVVVIDLNKYYLLLDSIKFSNV